MNCAKHYERLIVRARNRPLAHRSHEFEVHHVLPRCMGGSEDQTNLVRLTLAEHYIAHLLLARMYPEVDGVVAAAYLMGNRGQDFSGPRNKRYALAVRRHRQRWAKTGGNFIFRKRPPQRKRFSGADVERLKRMLGTQAN